MTKIKLDKFEPAFGLFTKFTPMNTQFKNLSFKFLMACFCLVLILSANKGFAQELIANNTKEKKILSLVAALPEVKKRAQEIKNLSNGKTQITLMISANPDVYIPYYQVNVNDNAPTYNNYYQFAVDPKTYQIFYYDAVKNRQYNLPEWRKMKFKGLK